MNQYRRLLKDPRLAILAAVAVAVVVIGIIAFVLTRSGPAPLANLKEPPGFSLTPSGQDAPRLAPVKVTFAKPPKERDPKKVLLIEPAPKGSYAWVSERTLLFQPEYPGLDRGATYTVKVAARPEADLVEDYKASFIVEGLLTVQSVIPAPDDTEVPTNGQILVQFSRAVAPLTLISSQPDKQVISFEPAIAGKGEWLNTSLYRFIPDAMAASTTFKAKIAANLASTPDGVLKEDYSWSFTTFSPAVSQVTPDNNTQFGAPRQTVAITFNQPMDRASVQSLFALLAPNKAAVAGAFAWSEGDTVVTFTPDSSLAAKTAYAVSLPAGFRGATGGSGKGAWNSSFTTVGAPGIAQSNPPNGSTSADRFGLNINFTNPMDMDSMEGKLSISPAVGTTPLTLNWFGSDRNLYLNATLKPSTAYVVTIAAGGKDRYGQPLPASSISFTTGQLAPSVSFATPGYGQVGTYSASSEPVLYFHATNTTSVPFTLYPLTAAEMGDLLANNGFRGPSFTPSQAPRRSWTQTVTSERDVVAIASTSLSGGGPLAKGDYYITSSGGGFNSAFAFSVVDTAIVTKLSNDELLNWVLDLDSGKPLSGVKVVPSGTGLTNVTGTTDANGLVSFKVPTVTTNGPGINRTYVVRVDDGGHRGLGSSLWTQGSEPFNQQIPVEYLQRSFVGHIYTDRPIYRPGEEVFWKGIVRSDDDASYSVPAADAKFEVSIRDPKGQELARQPATLNEFGSFTSSLTLPADAQTGVFYMYLQPPNPGADPRQFGPGIFASASFQVAEFKKPEYAVAVEADKKAYSNGDSIAAKTTAAFYFGGGVNGAKVEWSVLAFPTSFTAKDFPRYSFRDFDSARNAVSRDALRSSGTATTDAQGVAQFSVAATINGDEGAQNYTISTNVIDQNGQAVASAVQVAVHPADRYAGIKPAEYVASSGKETKLDLVALDLDAKPIPNASISVKVYDRKWVTTKVQTTGGARRYQSDPVDTLLATIPATTDAKGLAQVGYTPKATGTLRVTAEISDAKGRTNRSATYIWVSGAEAASWRVTNDDSFALIADKDSYEVGDTAKLLVPAPYPGTIGLLTVERGKVQTKEVRQFATDHETLSIPIGDKSVPDIFVTTVLYRPPSNVDPIPRYEVGYVELNVSTATRQLNVEIKPDHEQAKPGDKVKYAVKVTDSSGKGIRSELARGRRQGRARARRRDEPDRTTRILVPARAGGEHLLISIGIRQPDERRDRGTTAGREGR